MLTGAIASNVDAMDFRLVLSMHYCCSIFGETYLDRSNISPKIWVRAMPINLVWELKATTILFRAGLIQISVKKVFSSIAGAAVSGC